MKIPAKLFVIALTGIGASCGTISEDLNDTPSVEIATTASAAGTSGNCEAAADDLFAELSAPAPAGEVGSPMSSVPAEFAHLKTFDAELFGDSGYSTGRFAVKLAAGRYVGNLVLENNRSSVQGSGDADTVIDGNLIVGSQCTVTGLTVTGDVIFTGNNARVKVDCRGQVLDYGMQNRH